MRGLSKNYLKFHYILSYGIFMAVLIFALKWLQWKFLISANSLEVYIGLSALIFTALGIWMALKLVKPQVQEVVVEKEVSLPTHEGHTINESELEKLKLSKREYDVLQLLAKGYSNAEIADELFLSLSTVKTHVSNLLVKMSVKNRTHAVTTAKKMKIV
jgi:DNA-binding CsgD family transcriptional regulator